MAAEMIERVAKAIYDARWSQPHCDKAGIGEKAEARAAIAAMREPTKEMIECAESQFALFVDEYRRAIDAALKE